MNARSSVTSDLSLEGLVASAVSAGTPQRVAADAAKVTAARFRITGGAASVSSRARSYFWGVVRRRALRGGAPTLTQSLLALSLASELAAAGHGEDVVRREVIRVYGEPGVRVLNGALGVDRAASAA